MSLTRTLKCMPSTQSYTTSKIITKYFAVCLFKNKLKAHFLRLFARSKFGNLSLVIQAVAKVC
ncbi:hypothetical protein CQA63_09200 [Helicobacter marmotae]|uniref:Uncharacterized protein n=1 Tax=Helicobacter marmotae TaxID=152490 RepID=A0A3D8I140_9HELI|nr:hypothetical protein CQA63_09200 [Helicobacter marmotae]